MATAQQPLNTLQEKINLVTFRLNAVHYAFAVESIQEIIEMVTITPILKSEPWLEGVINYHGSFLPVVNLRCHFGMEAIPHHWHTPIILAHIASRPVGLIVDEVLDVVAFSLKQIVAPLSILPASVPEHLLLKGIVQAEGQTILFLDLAHLFNPEQIQALEAATRALAEQETQNQAGAASTEEEASRIEGT